MSMRETGATSGQPFEKTKGGRKGKKKGGAATAMASDKPADGDPSGKNSRKSKKKGEINLPDSEFEFKPKQERKKQEK